MSHLLRLLLLSCLVVCLPHSVQGKPRLPKLSVPPVAPVSPTPAPVSLAPAAPTPPPPNLPAGPVVLWGVQRGCDVDTDLSEALRSRIEGLGATLQELGSDPGLARACVGPECLELLRKGCAEPLPAQGSVIGGHVAVHESGSLLLATIRLFRTDFAAGRAPRTYYLYDFVEKACAGVACNAALRESLQALARQLISADSPSGDLPAVVHNAAPPYCAGREDLRQVLCKPLPIRSVCVGFDGNRDARRAVRCPFGKQSVATPAKPVCNCADVSGCTRDERVACGAVRGPLLRRVIGGSLLGAGGAFLLTAALLSVNDSRAAVLRRSVDCSYGGIEPEPCQSLAGAMPASWVVGVGLVAGGALVLLDPLRLFRDRPAPSAAPSAAPSVVPSAEPSAAPPAAPSAVPSASPSAVPSAAAPTNPPASLPP